MRNDGNNIPWLLEVTLLSLTCSSARKSQSIQTFFTFVWIVRNLLVAPSHPMHISLFVFFNRIALHWASMRGHREVIELLLLHGADVNCQDVNGRIPLHYSCNKGHVKASLCFLEHGSSVNQRDREHATPLHLVCKHGFPGLVSPLIVHGSDQNARMARGVTPLHLVCQFGWTSLAHSLLGHGANRDLTDDDRFTPLHMAAECGSVNCVILLLDDSGDYQNINTRGKDAKSALSLASKAGHVEVVQVLLDNNADVENCDVGKRTPLHWSMANGHLQVSSLLLQNGSDPFRKDRNGQSPLQLAVESSKLLPADRQALNDFCGDQTAVNLMRICRAVIRNAFSIDLKRSIESVLLPKKLKHFLCYSDVPIYSADRNQT